jgi:WD40 repeat protein
MIQIWEGQNGKSNLEHHGKSAITAINWVGGMLVSGSKSGDIHLFETSSGNIIKSLKIDAVPRAVDLSANMLTIGTRDGKILEIDTFGDLEDPENVPMVRMEGHDTGEAWGLDLNDYLFITSGDDNKVMLWDPTQRKCSGTAVVNTESRKAKKNKASTQGSKPES